VEGNSFVGTQDWKIALLNLENGLEADTSPRQVVSSWATTQ
jgi:hypothetical protein